MQLVPLCLILLDDRPNLQEQTVARLAAGEFAQAETLARQALAQAPPDTTTEADSRNNLAAALLEQGKLHEAEPHLRRAVELGTRLYGAEHPQVIRMLSNLAQLLADSGQPARAEPILRRTLYLNSRTRPADRRQLALDNHNLGALHLREGELDKARRYLTEAERLATDPEHRLRSWNALTQVSLRQQLWEAAEYELQQAHREAENLPANHPHRALLELNLASLRAHQGRLAEARVAGERAIRLQLHWYPANHQTSLAFIDVYRGFLERSHDRPGVQRLNRWIASMKRRPPGEMQPLVCANGLNCCDYYRALSLPPGRTATPPLIR